ncbi:MAG: flavin reductase family protein [Longimicrobiaceae bacterium]
MDPNEFRRIVGHFATGVTIITASDERGEPRGLTANAVCSVSLEPTLVLACVERVASPHDSIRQAGHFAVNVLAEERGELLARRFAEPTREGRFEGVAYSPRRSGAPVLADGLAWLDCRLRETLPGGDHTIFIGEVLDGDAKEGVPLLFYRGGYGRFTP